MRPERRRRFCPAPFLESRRWRSVRSPGKTTRKLGLRPSEIWSRVLFLLDKAIDSQAITFERKSRWSSMSQGPIFTAVRAIDALSLDRRVEAGFLRGISGYGRA